MSQTVQSASPVALDAPIGHDEVRDFLTWEADLLDQWQLNEWLELMTPNVRYLVPSLDLPQADFRKTLFMIADDLTMLRSRVRQLQGRFTWAENPRSRTRRMISNFRVLESQPGRARVSANFAVWRLQLEQNDVYIGRYEHVLVRGERGLMFEERKAMLDLETLRPHGKLSFIL